MKLRNKKTGEVVDFKIIADYDDCTSGWRLEKQDGSVLFYDHINEIKDEWEDYKPTEPLIKDEKIRKAVRAWAEANDVLEVFIDRIGDGTYMELYDEDDGRRRISALRPARIKTGEVYAIEELCGEEGECES